MQFHVMIKNTTVLQYGAEQEIMRILMLALQGMAGDKETQQVEMPGCTRYSVRLKPKPSSKIQNF